MCLDYAKEWKGEKEIPAYKVFQKLVDSGELYPPYFQTCDPIETGVWIRTEESPITGETKVLTLVSCEWYDLGWHVILSNFEVSQMAKTMNGFNSSPDTCYFVVCEVRIRDIIARDDTQIVAHEMWVGKEI